MPYYEGCRFPDFDATPTAAYITHLDDPGAEPELYRQFNEAAARASLRVCMNEATRVELEAKFGPTVAPALPVELDHFTLKQEPPGKPPVVGFSGYGYRSGRKGGELAETLVESFGDRCRFQASGRRWPCPTKKYRWKDMPGFFRALDIYVCTAAIEGGPMRRLSPPAYRWWCRRTWVSTPSSPRWPGYSDTAPVTRMISAGPSTPRWRCAGRRIVRLCAPRSHRTPCGRGARAT